MAAAPHGPHFLGATFVAAATVGLFCALRWLSLRASLPNPFQWQQLGLGAVASGALLGTYSHVILDGLVHSDVKPFSPWSESNPLLHLMSGVKVQWLCVALAVVGSAILYIRRIRGVRVAR